MPVTGPAARPAGPILPDINGDAGCLAALRPKRPRRPTSRASRLTVVSWDSADTDMSECICTICDCGKHVCPEHRLQPAAFTGNSRYREDFPAHPLERQGRPLKAHHFQSTPAGPDHFKSKYLEDFPGHFAEPAKSMKPMEAAGKILPFDGTTTNREVYTPKTGGPAFRQRPSSAPRPRLPFDGLTTHRELFVPHPDARPSTSRAPAQLLLATVPFEGKTAYADDFPAYDVGPRRLKGAPHLPYDYGPPRDLKSEHRAAFTEKPIHVCPVLRLPKKDPSMKTGHIHYTKKNATVDSPYSATL